MVSSKLVENAFTILSDSCVSIRSCRGSAFGNTGTEEGLWVMRGTEERLKGPFLYCLCILRFCKLVRAIRSTLCAKRRKSSPHPKRPIRALRWMMANFVEHVCSLEFRVVEVHGARDGHSKFENRQLRSDSRGGRLCAFFPCYFTALPWLQRRSNTVGSSHKYDFVHGGIPELYLGSKAA